MFLVLCFVCMVLVVINCSKWAAIKLLKVCFFLYLWFHRMKKIIFILCFFFVSVSGFSSHIIGGEIYYDCLGGNNYRIVLKLYRDCLKGQAPYDNPAIIGIFDSAGNSVKLVNVLFPGSSNVPYGNNQCLIPPSNVCVEEAIYDTVVNLPPIAGGYDIVYQRCCRNSSIINILDPGNTGSSYVCHIPDENLAVCNSSPRFKKYPPVFICKGQSLVFDHSAFDPDDDVLVYEFADPFDGNSNGAPGGPPISGPYLPIQWLSSYNAQYPISSLPAMAIDSKTGILTGKPNSIGQWVVCVRVKEYRNNQLVSVVTRDFQFNVVDCPPQPVTSFPSQTSFCSGMTVNFINNSTGSTWLWDFGDSLLTSDTSNLKTPTFTYSRSGVYNVSLITNPHTPCADTGFVKFFVYSALNPIFDGGPSQCFNGNSFDFKPMGDFQGTGTFLWSFGSNANPSTSSLQNITNVTYSVPGRYSVTLVVSENGCTKSFVDTVDVLPEFNFTYNPDPVIGCAPLTVSFSDSLFNAINLIQAHWDFGDSTNSFSFNPSHTYLNSGSYNVKVALMPKYQCVTSDSLSFPNIVVVNPSPIANIKASSLFVSAAEPNVFFSDLSQNGTKCWIYFGDGDSSNMCNVSHSYKNAGEYLVTQVVENEFGCKDTSTVEVEMDSDVLFWIPNTFTPNEDGRNDLFGPVLNGVRNYSFIIFDRWGNQVFESNSVDKSWDGRIGEVACNEDVYVWKIKFDTQSVKHKRTYNYVGNVALIH